MAREWRPPPDVPAGPNFRPTQGYRNSERGCFTIGVKNVNQHLSFLPMRQRKRCDLPVSFRSK
jgi:hypothetical protein